MCQRCRERIRQRGGESVPAELATVVLLVPAQVTQTVPLVPGQVTQTLEAIHEVAA